MNDSEIVNNVVISLKRAGYFDEMRKNIMKELVEEGMIERLQEEVKTNVEKVLERLPAETTTTEQVRSVVKKQLTIGFPGTVNMVASTKTDDPKVERDLRPQILSRVRGMLQAQLETKSEDM